MIPSRQFQITKAMNLNLKSKNQLQFQESTIWFTIPYSSIQNNTWADRWTSANVNFQWSFQIQSSWNPNKKMPVWMLHHQVTPWTFGSSCGSCIFSMGKLIESHDGMWKQIGTQRGASTIINRRGPGSPFIGQSPHATMKSDHEPQTSGFKVNKYWVLTVCKIRIVSQCRTNLDLVFWSLWPWYPMFWQLNAFAPVWPELILHHQNCQSYYNCSKYHHIMATPCYSDDYFCRMTTPPQTNQL